MNRILNNKQQEAYKSIMLESTAINPSLSDVFSQDAFSGPNKNSALIKKKTDWIPDESAAHCTNCYKQFNFFFRKHHCRICGQVYCKNCSFSKFLQYQNEKKNMRICNKCDEMYGQFQNDLMINKPLLGANKDQYSSQQQMKQSRNQDQGRPDWRNSPNKNEEHKLEFQVTHHNANNMSNSNQNNRESQQDLNSAYESRQSVREPFLINQLNEFGRESVKVNYMKELSSEYHNRKKNAQRRMTEHQKVLNDTLDKYLENHFEQIADTVMDEFSIDKETWRDRLLEFMSNAVKNIQPSSRLLNDSIDINRYIKIFLLEWKNQDKCQYVNGVVFSKNVAHKRMQTNFKSPKVLLITNSLGYVREEEGFMDIESVIKQEEPYVQIILSKIKKVEPDIILVEKDVSRLALDTLMADSKTVVSNVKSSVIKRLARLTQTIACPSTNLIDEDFQPGNCERFFVDKVLNRKKANSQLISNETSLMYLDGCEPYLGCTIILSGKDKEELKVIKKALKKMITISRILILEKEYNSFIQCQMKPDTTPFLINKLLQRDYLVFQMVLYSKKIMNDDIVINEEGQKMQKESMLKKKLNLMCQQPQKLLIHFYDAKEDTSLGTYILEMAKKSVSECPKCKELKLQHVICYYHKNGYVEIRLKSEHHLKNEIDILMVQLQNSHDILVHAYCNICKRIVIPQSKLSTQIYEMSFFKFLEQFFYNQDCKAKILEQNCNHRVHQDFSFIFKLGPIKLMFSFYKQDVYNLELQKFKDLQPTQISKNILFIKEQTDTFFSNFTASNQYIDDQLRQLRKKLKSLINNNQLNMSNQSKDNYMSLKNFLKKVKEENTSFKHLMLTSFPDLQFDSVLQLNRIHKNVIMHISHYLLIIKELCNIILLEINKPALVSKNQVGYVVSSVNLNQTENRAQSLYIEDFLLQNYPRQGTVMTKSNNNFSSQIETGALKKQGTVMNQQMNESTPQIANNDYPVFDFKFAEDKFLKMLFIDSPSIPIGYNKNCVQVSSHDFSSIIAFVLSSNLYIEGLIKINYMDLSNKVTSYREGQPADKNLIAKDLDFFNKADKFKLSEKYDILNKNATNHDIENELLNIDNYTFSFYFSSYGQPKNTYLKIYRNGHFISEIRSGAEIFMESQPSEEFKKIDTEFPKQFYEELNAIKKEITNVKLMNRQPVKGQNPKANDPAAKVENFKDVSMNEVYDINSMFQDKIDYSVKVYFPSQFEALRKLYTGSYESFIHSIFRSDFWHDNSGGKSKSKFFKSSDEKYIFKMVKSSELKMFREMGMGYFEYLCKSFFHYCPTCLAKILGAFKIKMKYVNQNKTVRFCLFVMENILLDINEDTCLKYDLKGSKRKRFIASKQKGQVLLDNNFLQDFNARPIAMEYVMKRLMQIAIGNDSFFLFKNNIVDYSLLVIIDKEKKQVRIGVIDYVQQWTIDKILESRFKKVINVGGDPTIVDPDLYKKRFKEAINKYFVPIYQDYSVQSFDEVLHKKKLT